MCYKTIFQTKYQYMEKYIDDGAQFRWHLCHYWWLWFLSKDPHCSENYQSKSRIGWQIIESDITNICYVCKNKEKLTCRMRYLILRIWPYANEKWVGTSLAYWKSRIPKLTLQFGPMRKKGPLKKSLNLNCRTPWRKSTRIFGNVECVPKNSFTYHLHKVEFLLAQCGTPP